MGFRTPWLPLGSQVNFCLGPVKALFGACWGHVLAFLWPQSPAQSRAQLWWESLQGERCPYPVCSPEIAEILFGVAVSPGGVQDCWDFYCNSMA